MFYYYTTTYYHHYYYFFPDSGVLSSVIITITSQFLLQTFHETDFPAVSLHLYTQDSMFFLHMDQVFKMRVNQTTVEPSFYPS